MKADKLSLVAALALTWVASGGPVPMLEAATVPAAEDEVEVTAAEAAEAQDATEAQDVTEAEPSATSSEEPAPAQAGDEPAENAVETPSQEAGAKATTKSGKRRTRGSFSPRARGLLEDMEAALLPIEAISIWDTSAHADSSNEGTSRAAPSSAEVPLELEASRGAPQDQEVAASDAAQPIGPQAAVAAEPVATGHPRVRPVFSPVALRSLDRMERSLVESRPVSTVGVTRDDP